MRMGLLGLWLILASRMEAAGDVWVVPNANAVQPGPGVLNQFSPGNFTRLLSVYNSAEFVKAMPDGGIITEIAYRIDEQDRTAFSATISDLEVRFSTSASLAPDLPLPFTSSVGADEKVVFPRGVIQFDAQPAAASANPFSIHLKLQNPFFYDPRQGSLGVDLWNYGSASGTVLLDAGNDNALSIRGNVGDLNGVSLAAAPVLQLTFQAVPEPSCLVLLMAGLAGWTFFQTRSRE